MNEKSFQFVVLSLHLEMSQVQVETPPTEAIGTASPTEATHQVAVTTPQSAAPATKRSNFSISNLLATEQDKSTPEISKLASVTRSEVREEGGLNKALAAGSPFLNASALAHLAHLHHGSSSSTSSVTAPSVPAGWTDWLGSAALSGSDSHQSLWSRYVLTIRIYFAFECIWKNLPSI